jgi:hypothetical protein
MYSYQSSSLAWSQVWSPVKDIISGLMDIKLAKHPKTTPGKVIFKHQGTPGSPVCPWSPVWSLFLTSLESRERYAVRTNGSQTRETPKNKAMVEDHLKH